ncbi:hypothetical protein B0I35DRAFT_460837 [Stachybotrys elegans]|uniref:Uncharacterized protein n=1 Tax=Stachybotrys elegans TaxID=80388 RepID=A0A8K0WRV2_9HYPO|nr:hypothetical protein B0I35DRAFT_460837 [Stachybotrys elegans]
MDDGKIALNELRTHIAEDDPDEERVVDFRRHWIKQDCKTLRLAITLASIEPRECPVENSPVDECISSYTVVRSRLYDEPTVIAVPGYARRWLGYPSPQKLIPHHGPDIQTYPTHPLEAAFLAAAIMSPKFSCKDIDLITDATSLFKLFVLCDGHRGKALRFNLQLVNNTLIVDDLEQNSPLSDKSRPNFDPSFQRQFTKRQEGDGELMPPKPYYRLIRYKLGDLSVLVRCKVDADLESSAVDASPTWELSKIKKKPTKWPR